MTYEELVTAYGDDLFELALLYGSGNYWQGILWLESNPNPNAAPSACAITVPSVGFSAGVGDSLVVSGTFTDPDNNVTQVEIFNGAVSWGTATLGSGTFTKTRTVEGGDVGAASLTAVATDAGGLTKTSAAVTGTVLTALAKATADVAAISECFLDADTNVVTTGTPVFALVSIGDQSTNGHDVLPLGTPPIWGTETDGYGSLTCSTQRPIGWAAVDEFAALTEGHGFIVYQRTKDGTGDTGNGGLWKFCPGVTDAAAVPYSNGSVYETFGSTTRKDAIATITAANPGLLRCYDCYRTATKLRPYMNGAALCSEIDCVDALDFGGASVWGEVPMLLSGTYPETTFHLIGKWRAFVLLDHVATADDRTKIQALFALKYGITFA